MRRIVLYSVLAIAVQATAVCLVFLFSESLLLLVVFLYAPTIALAQLIDKSTGCGRIVTVILQGILVGCVVYGIAAGLIIDRIWRAGKSRKASTLAPKVD